MKRLLIKSFIHLAIVAAMLYGYSFFYDAFLPKRLGPNTKQQILASYKQAMHSEYDVLILGNSRIYRGVNPDQFPRKGFNFAHDDDSYNQMYFKLEQCYAKNKFKVLLMGVDFFSFSYLSNRRNYVYGPLLGDTYLADYYPGGSELLNTAHFYWDTFSQRVVNYAGFDRTKMFIRAMVFGDNKKKPKLRPNGQYIYPGTAKESDNVIRDTTMLPIQKMYFEKIIDFCGTHGIRVFLIMPPIRTNELANYRPGTIVRFNRYFSSFSNATFLDFSTSEGFVLKDFTDITHLNEEAADRFSGLVNTSIETKMKSDIIVTKRYGK